MLLDPIKHVPSFFNGFKNRILMRSVLLGLKLMLVTFYRCLDMLLGSLIINTFFEGEVQITEISLKIYFLERIGLGRKKEVVSQQFCAGLYALFKHFLDPSNKKENSLLNARTVKSGCIFLEPNTKC